MSLETGNPQQLEVGRRARRGAALVMLLALLAGPAAAQWEAQSPVPTHLDVRGVAAPTAAHVFLATADDSFDDGGALWETTDGGSTWTQRAIPVSLGSPLNGIAFLDAVNGWAWGNENYRTTDGGVTWEPMPFLGSTYHMEFFTPTLGLAASNGPTWISFDGGVSWSAQANGIQRMDFVDTTNGLGWAADGIYRSTDGGATFVSVLAGAATDARNLSPVRAVAVVDGVFHASTDGGATWAAGESALGRTRLHPVDAEVVLAWGRSGTFPDLDDRLLRSTDGGATWADLGEVMENGVWGFTTLDPATLIACELGGDLHRSTDAGASWVRTFSSPNNGPGFLSSALPVFVDGATGYFGYDAGFVIGTTDGGASWHQISSGTGASLQAVDRFPGGDLIAVGDNGAVVRSSGGNGPWSIEPPFTVFDLQSVQVIGASAVVAVDAEGRVFRSSDAGDTWTAALDTPTGLSGEDLHFDTLLDGWVTGSGFSSAALFHTSDGGTTWTGVPGFQGGYVAVDFEGDSGWALNVSGLLQRTIDGGATWDPVTLPGSSLSLTDLEFFDVGVGYVVGRFGYAARTQDGGLSWEILPTPDSSVMFTDLHLLGPNEFWCSTADDGAYHSATGGQSWSVLNTGGSAFGYSGIVGVPGGDAWTVGFGGAIDRFTGPPPPPVNRPPAASFDFQAAGLTVNFTDTSNDPDGTIVSWTWDFGDSATSTTQSPSHTFGASGTYIVRLTVVDDDGDSGSTVRFIVAQPGPGGTFGDFTEVTPLDPLFVTPQDEDFWVATTAPADFDGDGDLDIAVLGYYVVYFESVVERLVLLRNDGPAGPGEWEFAYVDVPLGGLSSGASDLVWADVDGDGDQDLVMGSNGSTVLYRNDAGTLVMTDTVLPGYSEDNDQADFDLNSLSFADYDNDGDPDLLIPSVWDSSLFEYRTALCRNDGPNGTGGFVFTEVPAAIAPTSHAQTQWADFDGDQDLDLLVVNLAPLTDDGFIRRYRNDGAGVFVGEDILGTLTVEHGEVEWGDYDEDGDHDVLVAGHIVETDGTITRALRIYRNDAETYVPVEVVTCVPCDGWFDLTAAAWADYDSDGDMDILLTGTYNSGSQIEGRAKIFHNDAGVFTDSGNDLPAPRSAGTRGGTFSWLDLDGEGDLDYFIAGDYFVPGGNGLVESQMHAYRNDVNGFNLAPSAPTNLSATVVGGARAVGATVVLSWTESTDDLTPARALTYDLEVFQDGAVVATPGRLPQPGNVSDVTAWLLHGLPDGNYSWIVRAVDSALNGGPVAQGSFVVGGAVGVDPVAGLPRHFEFERSFPNPFRDATTFRFALPGPTRVNLDVFDAAGRRVATLLDEDRPPGVHEVRWEARGAASGVYFVRLRTDRDVETQRILRLR